MATENDYQATIILAGESLTGAQYHAISLSDGQLAANGAEASGIIMNKPSTGEGVTVGYAGEMKFAAGAGVAKGAKVTVTTSGWFITAGSGYNIVGQAKAAVSSGMIGTGLFNFTIPVYAFSSSFIA